MIRHLDNLTESRLDTDVCVVGGGAAGLTIARELSDTPLRVVVLESGDRTLDPATQSLYHSDVVGLAHGGIHEMRFRTLGGSTRYWGGQAVPLFPLDFEARAWVGQSGWPISRQDLAPYYVRAAKSMLIPPFPSASDAWTDALPRPPAFDPDLIVPFYSEFTSHLDFSHTHGAALARSHNVDILLGANVLELVTDPRATCVDVARARSLGGAYLEVSARFFVVCCGGIETARILLVSDRFSQGGLGNGRDIVGRYFQDHPSVAAGRIPSSGRRLAALQPRRSKGVKYLARFAASESLQRRERLLGAIGAIVYEGVFFPPGHQSQSPSITAGKLLYRSVRRGELRSKAPAALRTIARNPMPLFAAGLRYFALRRSELDMSGTALLGITCEQAPNAASRIYLVDSRDALGVRRVALDWQLTEHEIRTIRTFAEIAAAELERLDLASVDTSSFVLPDDPAALSGFVVDAGHHMGTTRMGSDASVGVVNSECRVYGIDNLYIAGCSVFPTGGCSNPTFTLLALAIRVADTVRARSGC